MVKIFDVKTFTTETGKVLSMLIVQGGLEPLVSNKTGKIYLTMRKANISTTFDEATCKSLVGTELPGNIEKVACEPYEYIVKETGEILTLKHNWQYIDEDLMNAHSQVIKKELVN
ncbi:hypothetical protein [Flavobacterium sp. M31R6]|uniref:hypothetical protein n=1 Tax=Flavobacterium sp. M31R6 TaxID=2739062 RepID=UPI001568705C|nr:hypothetical protein [Flavobacterium sp. M31R6]QKJ63343.1 hypothetical protein HQN62_09420 [Flavobacterium sp. M31R6]